MFLFFVLPGQTALHLAAEQGHADVIRALIAAGADVRSNGSKDSNGKESNGKEVASVKQQLQSPLILAVQANQPSSVAALLEGYRKSNSLSTSSSSKTSKAKGRKSAALLTNGAVESGESEFT